MKNLLLALLLLVGVTATAQEKKERKPGGKHFTSEQRVDFQVKKLTKDLDLNEKQSKEVRDIVAKEVEKREAKRAEIKEMKDKTREEVKAKAKEDQAAFVANMKKVLTPEQFSKWEKQREERKSAAKERIAERRADKNLKPIEE